MGRTLGDALLLRRGWGPGRGQPLAVDRSPAQRVGFSGTVVADYFGIAFLEKLHRIAERAGRRPCSPSVPVWTLNCPASKRMEPHSSRRSRQAASAKTSSIRPCCECLPKRRNWAYSMRSQNSPRATRRPQLSTLQKLIAYVEVAADADFDRVEFSWGSEEGDLDQDGDGSVEGVVTETNSGWTIIAQLPAAGLSAGDTVEFGARIEGSSATAGWNTAGALGTLTIVEPLSYGDSRSRSCARD